MFYLCLVLLVWSVDWLRRLGVFKRLAGKIISKMTYNVSSWMLTLL